MKRREKALPWEFELDSIGKFPRENMLKSSMGDTKAPHLSVSDNSKHQEDVKLYGQLPDSDDSQCYDLRQEGILRQVAHGIYANSHKPSWRTLKRRLFSVGIPKKLFREIKEIGQNGKKG